LSFLTHIPTWLKNKYLIASTAFLVWMLFFAENDIPDTIRRVQNLKQLKQTEQYQTKQIANTQKDLNLLKNNPQTIEKYAREQYLMKKDNEELFVVPATKEK
jgi:cell division protein DivIC